MFEDPAKRKYLIIFFTVFVLIIALIISFLFFTKPRINPPSQKEEERVFSLQEIGLNSSLQKTKPFPSCIQLLEVFEKNKQKNLPILDFNKDGKIDESDVQVIFVNLHNLDWCQYILDKVDLK